MIKSTWPRLHSFVAARFSPEGEAGLHLTVGLLAVLLAAWAFASIAEDVVSADRITLVDVQIANWLHGHGTGALTSIMLFITNWNSPAGVIAMSLPLAFWMYRQKARYWLFALVAVVPGGMLINGMLKLIFQRARPTFEHPLLTLTSYSFPSGHAAGATLFYGVLACYLVSRKPGWGRRAAIVAAACLMVALVAFSRMYLGVHYLSDVMAASAAACAWLAICISTISVLRRRRAARADQ